MLSQDNIQKIISTYKNRSSIDKYSSLASLSEIEQNDFNLNIPRYVDTYDNEEQVDMNAVKLEISRLENELKTV